MNRREFIEENVGWYLSVVTVGVKDNWQLLQSRELLQSVD